MSRWGSTAIIANVGMNTSSFDRSRQHLSRSLNTTKRQMQGVGQVKMTQAEHSWQNLGRSVSNAGRNIATVTGAITASMGMLVKSSVDTASSFEDAFADFEKVTDGTTEYFNEMDAAFRDMATRIPASYEEIAGAAAAASRLGVATDYIEDFAETALMMGTATNMGTEEAAESLARFSNIMGTSFEDSEKLGSAIVELGNNFATTEADIMAMSMRIAGAGANVNMTEADVLGLSAAMQSVGIRAEMGGTAMSKTINQISADLARGGDDAARWASRAGMSTEEFAKAFEEDALGAINSLLAGLDAGRESGENMNAMLEELGITEMRQVDVMNRMTNATDLLADAQERGNNAFQDNTALAEEAELRWQTFSAQMQMFRNRIRNITSLIGDVFIEVLIDLMDTVAPLAEAFHDWFLEMREANPELLKTIAKGLIFAGIGLAIVTVLATMATGFGFLITALGSIFTAFKTAAAAAGPVLSAFLFLARILMFVVAKVFSFVAILAIAAGALYYFYKENEEFAEGVNDAWEKISSKAKEVGGVLLDVFKTVGRFILDVITPVFTFMQDEFNRVVQFFKDEGDMIIEAFQNIGRFFKQIYETLLKPTFDFLIYDLEILRRIWDVIWWVIQETVLAVFNAVTNIISGTISIILGIIKFFAALFTGEWGELWESVKMIAKGAFQLIIGIIQTVLLLPVFRIFRAAFLGIRALFMALWAAVRGIFQRGSTNVVTTVVNFFKNIWRVITSLHTVVIALFRNMISNIRSITSTGMTRIWETIRLILGFVRDVFFNFFGWLGHIFMAVFGGLFRVVGRFMGKIFNVIVKILADTLLWLRTTPNRMKEIGRMMIQGMINGVKGMAKALWKGVTGAVSNAVDGVLGFLGIKSPSRLFKDIGNDTMEGMEIGVDEGSEGVKASMDDLSGELSSKGYGMADDAWDYGSDMTGAFDDMSYGIDVSMGDFSASLDGASGDMRYASSNMPEQAKRMAGGMTAEFDTMSKGMQSSVDEGFGESNKITARQTQALNQGVANSFKELQGSIRKSMRGTVVIVDSEFERIAQSTRKHMTQATNSARTSARQFESIGREMMSGMARGIRNNSSMVVTASAEAANMAALRARKELEVRSPSRVFMKIGEHVSEGMAIGISDKAPEAIKNVSALSGALTSAMRPTGSYSTSALTNAMRSSHSEAQRALTSQVSASAEVERQPAEITLALGKRDFKFFVEDITETQDRTSAWKDRYSAGR